MNAAVSTYNDNLVAAIANLLANLAFEITHRATGVERGFESRCEENIVDIVHATGGATAACRRIDKNRNGSHVDDAAIELGEPMLQWHHRSTQFGIH